MLLLDRLPLTEGLPIPRTVPLPLAEVTLDSELGGRTRITSCNAAAISVSGVLDFDPVPPAGPGVLGVVDLRREGVGKPDPLGPTDIRPGRGRPEGFAGVLMAI